MKKAKLATIWLDGCSGCHMSFLDIDERIIALGERADLVYSPLVDFKEFPEEVDIVLIEGAVSSDEDYEKLKKVREHCKIIVAMGDCAVTGNVTAMRNPFGVQRTMQRAFIENVDAQPQLPTVGLPKLFERVRPIHEVVKVDVYLPGCPPPADAMFYALIELLEGRTPDPMQLTRFGK